RSDLIEHLKGLGIAAGIHFMPVHDHAYFAGCRRDDMSVTDRVASEVITLPLHSNMKPAFVDRVIDGVRSFFR
ncbi:MAG: DegT/DnrJ/EryC1/StrS family aminotransferase, partial [Vulcanimicrobiaceae bacterium]